MNSWPRGRVPQCITRLLGELLTLYRMRKLVFLSFSRIGVPRATVFKLVSGWRSAPPCCAGQSASGGRRRRLQPAASRAAARFSPITSTEDTRSGFAPQVRTSLILRLAPKHQVVQARCMAPVARRSFYSTGFNEPMPRAVTPAAAPLTRVQANPAFEPTAPGVSLYTAWQQCSAGVCGSTQR